MRVTPPLPIGLQLFRRFVSDADEALNCVREIKKRAPLRRPTMRDGTSLRLRVTNAGQWGWWSDKHGYRYTSQQPDGRPWPVIPQPLMALWAMAVTKADLHSAGWCSSPPDSLLVNVYEVGESLGMHRDTTEETIEPIISMSFGCDALFCIEHGDAKDQIILGHGDLLIQSGPSRSMMHGIKKVMPTMTSPIGAVRVNLTFRHAKTGER